MAVRNRQILLILFNLDDDEHQSNMTYSHEPLIVTLAQVDELICLLGSLLNFLLGLLVLHLEHSDSISEQFYIVFNPDTWQHNKNKVDISCL